MTAIHTSTALIERLRSQAAHDGKTFPAGGTPPDALMRALLLEAAAALAAQDAKLAAVREALTMLLCDHQLRVVGPTLMVCERCGLRRDPTKETTRCVELATAKAALATEPQGATAERPARTHRQYQCDHCRGVWLVEAETHEPRGCTLTNCHGRQSPLPEPASPCSAAHEDDLDVSEVFEAFEESSRIVAADARSAAQEAPFPPDHLWEGPCGCDDCRPRFASAAAQEALAEEEALIASTGTLAPVARELLSRMKADRDAAQEAPREEVIEIDEDGIVHMPESAERTLRSIATMLGWGNVPPRETLERNIAALKARASSSAPPVDVAALRALSAQWRSSDRIGWCFADDLDRLLGAPPPLTAKERRWCSTCGMETCWCIEL